MIKVGLANFQAEVKDQTVPVVVDFYADWCGPCRSLKPVLEQLEAEGHKIVKLDITEEPELAGHFGISALPTLLAFKNGEPVAKAVGTQNRDTILKLIAEAA